MRTRHRGQQSQGWARFSWDWPGTAGTGVGTPWPEPRKKAMDWLGLAEIGQDGPQMDRDGPGGTES